MSADQDRESVLISRNLWPGLEWWRPLCLFISWSPPSS